MSQALHEAALWLRAHQAPAVAALTLVVGSLVAIPLVTQEAQPPDSSIANGNLTITLSSSACNDTNCRLQGSLNDTIGGQNSYDVTLTDTSAAAGSPIAVHLPAGSTAGTSLPFTLTAPRGKDFTVEAFSNTGYGHNSYAKVIGYIPSDLSYLEDFTR